MSLHATTSTGSTSTGSTGSVGIPFTSQSPPKASEPDDTSTTTVKKVTEGSCHMCFAATEETAVFYNPVQVQNRDLSVLMISLYADRRRTTERARLDKKAAKKLIQSQKPTVQSNECDDTPESAGTATNSTFTNASLKGDLDAEQTCNANSTSANTYTGSTGSTLEHVDATNDTTEAPIPNTDVRSNDTHNPLEVKLHVLDALAASGLRSMRYWKECPDIHHVTINDLDPAAYDRARQNIDSNRLTEHLIDPNTPGRPRGIRIQTSDATQVMYNSRQTCHKRPNEPRTLSVTGGTAALTPEQEAAQQWDIIDLDPYGSAAPFLDAAVQAITHGGMLNITCTDMAALGGSHPETCFGRYGCMPISRAGYLQELAVRILLYAIATSAARYGRTIRPVLSVGMDFYVRVFVEVYDDKATVNALSLNVGNVYQSTQCPSFHVVPSGQLGGKKGNVYQPSRLYTGVCTETGSALKVAGPLWTGPMHNRDVLLEALQRLGKTPSTSLPNDDVMSWIATRERLRGLLTSCREELSDVPLFYRLPDLSKCLHLSTPPVTEFKSALVNAGYRVSGYHKDPHAIKTDAPTPIVWDILRAWARKRPPHKPAEADSVAAKILAVEPSIAVDFTTPSCIRESNMAHAKISRFPMNPQSNWGPKPKASGNKRKAESSE